MKLIKLFSLIIILYWLNLGTSFANPPKILYRVDNRGPDIIFHDGFRSWGNDNNIIHHIAGDTIENHTSAFIGTTSRMSAAHEIMNFLFAQYPQYRGQPIWLYRIVPDNNVWSVTTTLRAAQNNQQNEELRSQASSLLNRYLWQDEWVAEGAIPPSRIIDAVSYFSNGATPGITRGSTRSNSSFRRQPPANANPNPYPIHDDIVTSPTLLLAANLTESTTLEMPPLYSEVCDISGSSSREKRETDVTKKVCNISYKISYPMYKQMFNQSVTNKLILLTLPLDK